MAEGLLNLAERAEETVPGDRFTQEKERLGQQRGYTLTNKEALMYYDMLRAHYQDEWIMPSMGKSRSL